MSTATEARAKVEPWEDDEVIITLDGRPVGFTLDRREAERLCEWFNAAIVDMDVRAKPAPPTIEEAVTLAQVIDAVLGVEKDVSVRLRFVMVDALNALGPAWHTFAIPTKIRDVTAQPGEPVLLVSVGSKVTAFNKKYIPSWVGGKRNAWDESTHIVLPAKLRDRYCKSLNLPASPRKGHIDKLPPRKVKTPWDDW